MVASCWLFLNDLNTHTHTHTHTHTYRYIMYGGPVGWDTELQVEKCGFNSRWATGKFLWLNPSGRTVALGSTHPPAEKSARDGRCEGLKTLPPWCADSLGFLGGSTPCSPLGPVRQVKGETGLPFIHATHFDNTVLWTGRSVNKLFILQYNVDKH